MILSSHIHETQKDKLYAQGWHFLSGCKAALKSLESKENVEDEVIEKARNFGIGYIIAQ